MGYEPRILALCCHYCAYAAADLAGSLRLQYPSNVRVLRFPCTGKIEPNTILSAFEKGIDGVMVAGCLEGGCHFLEGNLRARRRVERPDLGGHVDVGDRLHCLQGDLDPPLLDDHDLASRDGRLEHPD